VIFRCCIDITVIMDFLDFLPVSSFTIVHESLQIGQKVKQEKKKREDMSFEKTVNDTI